MAKGKAQLGRRVRYKLRRDDDVVVLSGRSRGRQGKVLRVLPDGRLLVEGVNIVKRHQRPDPARNRSGGIVEQEAPIDASNVGLLNPETGRAGRIGFEFDDDGKKRRVFRAKGSSTPVTSMEQQ